MENDRYSELGILQQIETSLEVMRYNLFKQETNANNLAKFLLRDSGGKIVQAHSIHSEIQEFIDYCFLNDKYANILVSQGHGKTEQIIMRICYEIIQNRNIRIMLVCENDDSASKRVVSITNYLRYYIDYENQQYPELKIKKANEHSLLVDRRSRTKDITLQGFGITSKSTGVRTDLLILDDALETIDSCFVNPSTGKKIDEILHSKLMTRLDRNGKVIHIGTQYVENGNISHLINDSRFYTLKISLCDNLENYEMIKIIDGKQSQEILPRWDYFPKSHWQEIQKNRPRFFRIAYQLQPESSEKINPFGNIKNLIKSERDLTEIIENSKSQKTVKSIDLSGIGRKGTVITTATITENSKVIISDAQYTQFSFTELRDYIITETRENPNLLWVIETNAFQKELIRMIREKQGNIYIDIIEHITGKNKNDIDAGLLASSKYFNEHQIFFLKDNVGVESIIREYQNYGILERANNDGIMSVWFILYNLKKILLKITKKQKKTKFNIYRKKKLNEYNKY